MRIANNIVAINTNRMLSNNSRSLSKSTEKLSSGLRINRSGDDAAGLAISEKMRAQIRGLNQASRNAQDGISLIQTAEGALGEIHQILQKGRELSVQASNGVNTQSDLQSIQEEIDQLIMEVDRIAEDTEFNTIKLLDGTIGLNKTTKVVKAPVSDELKQTVIDGLKSGWLEEGVKLVNNFYGLNESNRTITVVLDDGTPGDDLASIQTSWSLTNANTTAAIHTMELHIDLSDFDPSTGENGENTMTTAGGTMYNDRIIAHEMAHAVMADVMGDDFFDMPTWFVEGTAEFIHGADDRLEADVANAGGIQNVVDRAFDLMNGAAWASNSLDYSASYLIVKYVEANLNGGASFSDIIAGINDDNDNTELTLNAIVNNTGFLDVNDFMTSFQADGANFYNNDLTIDAGPGETDTGSIGGSDHNGVALNPEDVVPTGVNNDNPTNFNFVFPNIATLEDKTVVEEIQNGLSLQIGANANQTMYITLDSVKSDKLNIEDIDVVSDAESAITKIDEAINNISQKRSKLGAYQNRLEYTIKNLNTANENLANSESRIRNLDMASEMIKFTKNNILLQATQSMLSQSNQAPKSVLQLLG